LCGLLKGEKQDFVVQKATELGAARIVPVACRRSVPQLDSDQGEKRQKRWQRIALAAAQQCRRLDVPEVTAPTAWSAAIGRPGATHAPIRLLLYEGMAPPLGAVLRRALAGDDEGGGREQVVEILIGPEGGFAADEVSAAIDAGFLPASLGPLTLRAETAVVAALAVVQYALAAGTSTGLPEERALDMAFGS
jgi:16S rRNA (uracil1498-N3)-methyltransferase